jgi:hypothetical protein
VARVSVELIEDYLDRFGLRKHERVDEPDELEGYVLTGWTAGQEGEGFLLSIDPMIERGLVAFRVHHVAEAPAKSTAPDRLPGSASCDELLQLQARAR